MNGFVTFAQSTERSWQLLFNIMWHFCVISGYHCGAFFFLFVLFGYFVQQYKAPSLVNPFVFKSCVWVQPLWHLWQSSLVCFLVISCFYFEDWLSLGFCFLSVSLCFSWLFSPASCFLSLDINSLAFFPLLLFFPLYTHVFVNTWVCTVGNTCACFSICLNSFNSLERKKCASTFY